MYKIRLRNIITICSFIKFLVRINWSFTGKWIFSLIIIKSKSCFCFVRNLWSNLATALIILNNYRAISLFFKSHSLIFKFTLSHLINIILKSPPNCLCSLHLILISLIIFKWKIRLNIVFPICFSTL
jgi:hypothetical protein